MILKTANMSGMPLTQRATLPWVVRSYIIPINKSNVADTADVFLIIIIIIIIIQLH